MSKPTDPAPNAPISFIERADTNSRCLGCDSHVLPKTVKFYGDNDGNLYGCPECVPLPDLRAGAGRDPDYDAETDRENSKPSGYHPVYGGEDA